MRYEDKGTYQVMPIPVADMALRLGQERELRMYMIIRKLYSTNAGYFTKADLQAIRKECSHIKTERTFRRHFALALRCGFIERQGTKFHFAGISRLLKLAAQARGMTLGKARYYVEDDLGLEPRDFRAAMYTKVALAMNSTNVRRARYEGKRAPSLNKHSEEGRRKLNCNYGKVSYRYFNVFSKGREVSLSKQSRLTKTAKKAGFIEHHWHCCPTVDKMNIRKFSDMSKIIPMLAYNGIEPSRIFKAKYGEHSGKFRVLLDVSTLWKGPHSFIFFSKKTHLRAN